MTDIDRLEQRLSAVERVVVDGERSLDELEQLSALADAVDDLETRVEEQERRIADLEAGVQSIESYVGNVESINDDVERQAASAVATVDRLERRVETLEVELDELRGGVLEDDATAADGEPTDTGPDTESERTVDGNGDAGDDVAASETATPERGETTFEFGANGESEPTPEQTVANIVEGADEPRSIVDDDTNRTGSSANQEPIAAALDGNAAATRAEQPDGGATTASDVDVDVDADSDSDAETETDGGLLASLRTRFA